jgi:hypothetical protein
MSIAAAKSEPLKGRFFEMAGLSLSVAAFSFLVGCLIRILLGMESTSDNLFDFSSGTRYNANGRAETWCLWATDRNPGNGRS